MTQRFIGLCRFVEEDGEKYGEKSMYGHTKASEKRDYEYLLPEGATGEEKFAVVSPSNKMTLGGLKIVRITAVRPTTEQEYAGDLKPVVAAFAVAPYLEWTEKLAKRRALMIQVEKKVSERSKIAQLEALAGDDPEARQLLDALKAL